MTFDELWKYIAEMKILPDTAIAQVPGALSSSTKKKLARKGVRETAEIVSSAIDEVDHGSVVPLDELVKRGL